MGRRGRSRLVDEVVEDSSEEAEVSSEGTTYGGGPGGAGGGGLQGAPSSGGPQEALGGPRPVGPPGPPQRPPGTLDSYCINNNSKEDEATLTVRPQVDTPSSP